MPPANFNLHWKTFFFFLSVSIRLVFFDSIIICPQSFSMYMVHITYKSLVVSFSFFFCLFAFKRFFPRCVWYFNFYLPVFLDSEKYFFLNYIRYRCGLFFMVDVRMYCVQCKFKVDHLTFLISANNKIEDKFFLLRWGGRELRFIKRIQFYDKSCCSYLFVGIVLGFPFKLSCFLLKIY